MEGAATDCLMLQEAEKEKAFNTKLPKCSSRGCTTKEIVIVVSTPEDIVPPTDEITDKSTNSSPERTKCVRQPSDDFSPVVVRPVHRRSSGSRKTVIGATKEEKMKEQFCRKALSEPEKLRKTLGDAATTEELKLFLPTKQRPVIHLWEQIQRFLAFSTYVDAVVANAMVHKICETYSTSPVIPRSIRKQLKIKEQKSLEDRTDFVLSVQEELFDYILMDFFPKFLVRSKKKKSRSKAINRLTSSINLDPFEDTDSELVEYVKNEETGEDVLIAATPAKIIYYLTTNGDLQQSNYYLLTYTYYMSSPMEFINLLISRFALVLRSYHSKIQQKANAAKITILKIVNVMKLWIDLHSTLIKNDEECFSSIMEFACREVKSIIHTAGANLQQYLLTKTENAKKKEIQFSQSFPKIKTISLSKKQALSIEDIHSQEFARQMALVDHGQYKKILPNELLHLNWTKDGEYKSPNVMKMIAQFNRVGNWVVTTMSVCIKRSRASKLLLKLIDIAYESFVLSNFNGAMALVAGLKNKKIVSRKPIWDSLSSSSWDKWERLVDVLKVDNNFGSLREEMKTRAPPIVPYLGLYLSSLTFKEMEPTLTQEGLVNLTKLSYIGNVINNVKQGQESPYCLEPYLIVQTYIETLPCLPEKEIKKKVPSEDLKRSESTVTKRTRQSVSLSSEKTKKRAESRKSGSLMRSHDSESTATRKKRLSRSLSSNFRGIIRHRSKTDAQSFQERSIRRKREEKDSEMTEEALEETTEPTTDQKKKELVMH